MFFPKPQVHKIKPTLFPGPSLLQKLQSSHPNPEDPNIHNACLLKYFPKYHKSLEISLTAPSKSAQNKVRLLKIIHKVRHYPYIGGEKEEKIVKKLLQTSRKTLKSLPTYEGYCPLQRHNLCLYFPRVTSLDLSYNHSFKGENNLKVLTRSVEKEFYRAHGYFWDGNRCVKKLKITNQNLYYWAMLKKLGESKRFLKSLETLQLSMNLFANRKGNKSLMRDPLVEFLKNKDILECVTHLKVGENGDLIHLWQLLGSLINSCHKLSFLSLPIPYYKDPPVGFSLDFGKLESLQEMELRLNKLPIFISGVELPQSLRKMTLQLSGGNDFLETFGCKNGPSLFSLEKHQIKQGFFNKWKSLQNLKVLKLIVPIYNTIDLLFKNFVVPLLKAIPQLETFGFKWFNSYCSSSLNLDVLLEGIEPLRSLRNLKISPDSSLSKSSLAVNYNPQKVYFLPHVASIKIDAAIAENFDLNRFISTILYNVKLKVPEMTKNVKLSSLKTSCAKQLIKTLQTLHIVSDLKTVKFEMEIELVNQTLPSLMENFEYPIYIPKNLLLTVNIKLVDSTVPIYLTEGLKQYLRGIFSQLDFTISYLEKSYISTNFIFTSPKNITLLSSLRKRL